MANGEERDETEVIGWFKSQLEVKSPKKLARELGVNKSTVNRNRKRVRMGKRPATPFRRRCERRMDAEEREAEEKAADDEMARQEGIEREREAQRKADREAKEKADRVEEEAAAKKEEEEERRQQEKDEAWEEELQSWEEKLRAAGYVFEGAEGDAGDLLIAGITKFGYVDVGTAAVALLPDDVMIWRDKTAAYFREGITFRQRLRKRAVRNGQTPEMIGNFPASAVYYDPLPGELWRYGRAGLKVIAEWRRLTDAYGHLATGKMPKIVHPETVAGFERLITIEEKSRYAFVDSRLGPDARDRLKVLKCMAAVRSIGLTTCRKAWRGSKAIARWSLFESWKWVGLPMVFVTGAIAFVGLIVTLAQPWNWVLANKEKSLLGLVTAVLVIILAWIAGGWVRQGDSLLGMAGRLGIVALFPIAVGLSLVALMLVFGYPLPLWDIATESLKQRLYPP